MIKLSTKLFVLTMLSLSAQAQDAEQATLSFIDPETKTASDVDVGDGLRAIVDLPMMPDHKRLDIELLVFPEFKLDEAPLYERRYKTERSDIDGNWRKVFRIPSFRDKENLIQRFGRVGRVRISWKDPQNGDSGTLIRKFYLLETKDQKFFKILAPGDLRLPNHADIDGICSYRKDVEVVGPYLQNPALSPQEYEFNQSVALETMRYRGPLNAGIPQRYGYNLAAPFQLLSEGDLGWLMTGWSHFEGKETKVSFKPKITLQPAQGGYFIKETLVKRYKAQKYLFNKKLGTSEWIASDTGYLDIGSTQYNFITLSFADSQDPAKLEQNLKEHTALMTTCTSYPIEAQRIYHTGNSNTLHEELFFFPID